MTKQGGQSRLRRWETANRYLRTECGTKNAVVRLARMRKVRIFVSSVIDGLEVEREMVECIVSRLGCEPIMAERQVGLPATELPRITPQSSCLFGVERSDIIIGLIGPRYGDEQESGLSATHEELRHALRLGKPMLVFVDKHELEDRQKNLVKEISQWETGRWIFWVNFCETTALATEIQSRVRPVVENTSPDSLLDNVIFESEARTGFESAAAKGSAPCCAFLIGDWSILKTKQAWVIPLDLRVRVVIDTARSFKSRVVVYHRSGREWILDSRYSSKLTTVIQDSLEDSLIRQEFPSLPKAVHVVVFSDVEFGVALHEDAAFSLATAAALHELCRFDKRDILRLAGLLLCNWYAQVSWATLVCSFTEHRHASPLLYFDRSEDGGIDLEDITYYQRQSSCFDKNALLTDKGWVTRHHPFGLDRVSVWLGERASIDIDDTLFRYSEPLKALDASIMKSIAEQMKRRLTGGQRSYDDIGLLMNMHHCALHLAGFIDHEYYRLTQMIMGQPGVLVAKPGCARGKGAILVLTEAPLDERHALVTFMLGYGLKPLLLMNRVPRGTLAGPDAW